MFLFFVSRFHITINYYHEVVRYAWHSVTGFNKTWIGGMCMCVFVLRRENCHVLRRALELEVEIQ